MRRTTSAFWLSLVVCLAMPTAWGLAQSDSSTSLTNNSPQVPQPAQSGVNWTGVGIGAGTIAGNVLYVPAKLVYGILGGIGGGAGYVLTGGNKQVADTIWRSSLGGDYVLTPNMVSGKQPVHFSGPTQTAVSGSTSYGSSASTSTTAAATTFPSSSTSTSPKSAAVAPIDSGAGPVKSSTSSYSSYPSGSSYSPSTASYPSTSSYSSTTPVSSSTYPVTSARTSSSGLSEAPVTTSHKTTTASSSTAIE